MYGSLQCVLPLYSGIRMKSNQSSFSQPSSYIHCELAGQESIPTISTEIMSVMMPPMSISGLLTPFDDGHHPGMPRTPNRSEPEVPVMTMPQIVATETLLRQTAIKLAKLRTIKQIK